MYKMNLRLGKFIVFLFSLMLIIGIVYTISYYSYNKQFVINIYAIKEAKKDQDKDKEKEESIQKQTLENKTTAVKEEKKDQDKSKGKEKDKDKDKDKEESIQKQTLENKTTAVKEEKKDKQEEKEVKEEDVDSWTYDN